MAKPDLRPLAVSTLVVDPDVQRGLDIRRVNKIAEALDLDALGVVTVSHRANGNYHIVDGQHRVSAVKLAGGETEKILCRIFSGLSIEDEARLFRLLNNTAKPQALDLFRVRVIEGDPVAVDIDRIISAHGWKVMFSAHGGAFGAVAAAERIHRLDPAALDKAVATLTRAWGHDDTATVDGRLVEGVGLVYARYGIAVEASELTDRLARSGTPAALLGKARTFRDTIGGTVTRAVAEIVVEMYNVRRKTKALPSWRAADTQRRKDGA
jgi:hypothetical protein